MNGTVHCFYADLLNGVHGPDDDYRLALFIAKQSGIGPETTHYTKTGEVSGRGYSAGGIKLTGRSVTQDGKHATLAFSAPRLAHATLEKVDQLLLYNATQNRAIAVFACAPTSATNGPWSIEAPSVTLTRSE